ncbi:MAG: hypothetical protein PVI90_01650 [Desulfobacteraceae bacterium]|jgi:hypothetical protein
MEEFYIWLDKILISFYRFTGIAIIDYLVGTTMLCFMCVVIGQMTYCWVYRRNHHYLFESGKEMMHMHKLSLRALKAKNKAAYSSCNIVANDAFGKHFFAQIATGMATIWPLPFLLAWMQWRFGEVDFILPVTLPLLGNTVGYLFTFFPIYIVAYIIFNRFKRQLPYFSYFNQWVEAQQEKI